MKQKTLGLFGFGILVLVLALGLGSAAITFDTMPTVDPYGTSFTFNIKSDIMGDVISIDVADMTDGNGNLLTFTDPAPITIDITNHNTFIPVTVNYLTGNFDFELGETYSTTIQADGLPSGNTSTATLVFSGVTLCEDCENHGSLELRVEDVKVTEGFGDDDYWYPYDVIEVELEIENNGNWDIDNIEVEWALYTTAGKKIMDDTLNDFNLKDGKDEVVTFTFKLDEDIDDFENEDAVLYISARGEIDDNDAGIHDGEDTCDSEKIETEVIADDDFLILDDFRINGVELDELTFNEYDLTCGQEITITTDVWNIGSEDFEDVSIQVYNSVLGINEILEIGDVDSFENTEVSFSLTLPKDVNSKWYTLKIGIYDDDNDLFENSKDDESEFDVLFKLGGTCGLAEPVISAELLTEAIENQEMTIKVTVKNPGTKDVSYRLNAVGFSGWAELIEISDENINLNAGESREVLFKFKTTKESAGERFFDIEIFADNKLITKQPVVVSIEEVENNAREFFQKNWKLLVIGLVNLILIIAIIIVAVRTYRR